MAIFNKIAGSYDSWYDTPMGEFVDAVETDLAFRMFKVEKGMKILDVGCGTGNFSIKLAEKGCRVIGIDISDNMLDTARKKATKAGYNINFYNMDVYKLDFEDEEFDGVFSMAAFEFITQPEKALDELLRVTKKGGQVLVGTISRNSSWGELYLTDEYQRNSVFKYADFKTLDEMKSWRTQSLVNAGECLFVPPASAETDFNMQKEQELAGKVKGGYICAAWIK
jgi:ubiquinone biosynthesis O-methyltransferase